MFRFLLAAALLAALASARAQITVVKTAGHTLDLAGLTVPATPEGALFKSTLERNLARSGWVSMVPRDGSHPVTGSFSPPAAALLEIKPAGFRRAFTSRDNDPRRLAQEASDAIVEALTGRKGMARSRLAFSGNRTGHWELYLCDADGENLQQITRDRGLNLYPHWSPDGRQLVFTSYRNRFPDLYRLTIDTWELAPLARFNGLNTGGAYAPNGQEIAVTLSASGNPEIYIMRPPARGGRLFRITHTPTAAETGASWSPDGNRLVYVSDSSGSPQLYIVSRAGGERTRLPVSGTENVSPDWGPDGRIAFASRRGGRHQICVYSPDTGDVHVLTEDGDNYEDPVWAPDGRHIACTRVSGSRMTIMVLDTMGKPPVPLLSVEGQWRGPAWSPRLP